MQRAGVNRLRHAHFKNLNGLTLTERLRAQIVNVHALLTHDAGEGRHDVVAVFAPDRHHVGFGLRHGILRQFFKVADHKGEVEFAGFERLADFLVERLVGQAFRLIQQINARKLVVQRGLGHFFDIAAQTGKGGRNGGNNTGLIKTDDGDKRAVIFRILGHFP